MATIYSDLITGVGSQTDAFSTFTGYAFEFAEVSTQLTLDPSFSIAVEDQLANDVSAIAVLPSIQASTLNGFIKLNVDSKTPSTNDPKTFRIDPSILYQGLGGTATEPGINFSTDADVTVSMINSVATEQTIQADVIRNLAFQITGGYGASDIFNNEAALIADVGSKDGLINTEIQTNLDSYVSNNADANNDIDASGGTDTFDKVLNNLFAVVINDPTRRSDLFTSLLSSDTATENLVDLKFDAGDVITFKVSYVPKTATFSTNSATIDTRSYRVVLPLT